MSSKITQSTAKDFIEFYNEACLSKGESQSKVIRSFVLTRASIEAIFAAADSDNIPCDSIRIYFGKKSAYDPATNLPKFCSEDDYNLVVVGVDNKDENINSTGEIYDHLASQKGASSTPSGVDF